MAKVERTVDKRRLQRWSHPDGSDVIEGRAADVLSTEQIADSVRRMRADGMLVTVDEVADWTAQVQGDGYSIQPARRGGAVDLRELYNAIEATLRARSAGNRTARVQAKRRIPVSRGRVFSLGMAKVTIAESFVRVAQLVHGASDEDMARVLFGSDSDGVAKVRRVRQRLRVRRQWIPIP